MRRHPRKPTHLGLRVALALALGAGLSIPATSATAAGQTEVVADIAFDGTAFTGDDPLDPGTGRTDAHTPGQDERRDNGVVRTFDNVGYTVHWNVNEEDVEDATLTLTLPPNMVWKPAASTVTAQFPNGMFAGCLAGSALSSSGGDFTIGTGPAAQVRAVGLNELTCVVGDADHEGTNGTIRPIAQLVADTDDPDHDRPLTMDAELTTSNSAPVSDSVDVVASAAPAGDIIKGRPGRTIGEPTEVVTGVTRNGEAGRILLYTFTLQPSGGQFGYEPFDSSKPVTLYDVFWDSPAGTSYATSDGTLSGTPLTELGGRSACGAYDGDGGYPADSATVTCTNVSTAPSTTELAISDWSNTPAATLANGDRNSAPYLFTAQVAYFVSEADLATATDPNASTGRLINTVKGNDTAPTDENQAGDDPAIQLPTFAGTTVDEVPGTAADGPYDNNDAAYPFSTVQTSPGGDSPNGLRMVHRVNYYGGPWQVLERPCLSSFCGTAGAEDPMLSVDYRVKAQGGIGADSFNGSAYDDPNNVNGNYDGGWQVSRGQRITLSYALGVDSDNGFTNPVVRDAYGCVALDTTHYNVSLPPEGLTKYTTTNFDPGSNVRGFTVTDRETITPSDQIAQVYVGSSGYRISEYYFQGVSQKPENQLPYTLEFASSRAGYTPNKQASTATTVTDPYLAEQNRTTCNTEDADARGWVPSTGDLGVFDANGDGTYEDIDLVRLTIRDQDWRSGYRNSAGASLRNVGLSAEIVIPAVVKNNPNVETNGQELFLSGSRGSGEWSQAPGTQPAGGDCIQPNNLWRDNWNNGPDGNGPAGRIDWSTSTGWCNLPYSEARAGAADALSPQAPNYDTEAVEVGGVSYRQWGGAHTDKLYIVDPRLDITKRNVDGPDVVKDQGDFVDYRINVSAIGAGAENIEDVVVTDNLPSTLTFDSFLDQPADGTCTSTATSFRCDFGDRPGGWSDTLTVRTVVATRPPAGERISNTATATGVFSGTDDAGAPVTRDLRVSASDTFLAPAAYTKGAIVKAVETVNGDCTAEDYPAGPVDAAALPALPADWTSDCELVPYETTAGSQTTTLPFQLRFDNLGNEAIRNLRVIDVFPHNGDEVEPTSATGVTGDGRTPETDTAGTVRFAAYTGPGTYWLTADAPGTVSRDPENSIRQTTWCTTAGVVANAAQLAAAGVVPGACPTTQQDSTAIYVNAGNVAVDAAWQARLDLTSTAHECNDLWTNTFGARDDNTVLPIRSNDVSLVPDCDFDLALRKTVADDWTPAPGWITPGTSTVTFDLEVFNQGDPVNNLSVVDYVDPALFTAFDPALNQPGTSAGDATLPYAWDASDPLKPVLRVNTADLPGADASGTAISRDDRLVVPVTLTVADGYAVGSSGPLRNTAEISRFDDDADDSDEPPTDTDSTPDTEDDEPGAGKLVDDVIDNSSGDEDDHDIADVPVYDLALRKVVDTDATPTPLVPGAAVMFTLTVFNQGTTSGTDVQLSDYVDTSVWEAFDAGLNPAGETTGDVELPYTWSADGTNGLVALDGTLDPGEQLQLPVTLRIRGDVAQGITLDNLAEISGGFASTPDGTAVTYPDGSPLPDVDSTPDRDNGEPGAGKLVDDVIDNSSGDEDDHDIASVTLATYDLALRKVVDTAATKRPLLPGAPVTFTLTVFNQGTTSGTDVELSDYVDTSVWEAFDAGLNPAGETTGDVELPYTWSADGTNGLVALDGTLDPGEQLQLPVTLRIRGDVGQGITLDNLAEISGGFASTPDGTEVTAPDGSRLPDTDSTPDSDNDEPGAGKLVDDVIDNSSGDEDDHDIASVGLDTYDLALIKLLVGVDGDVATYRVLVTNQGDVDSGTITVSDTIPVGTSFVDASDGGRYDDDRTVTWTIDSFAPGEVVERRIRVRGEDFGAAPFVNEAAITDAPFTDEDSDPKDDNDEVIDRVKETDTGIDQESGDTDDHDVAVWDVTPVDVSIAKRHEGPTKVDRGDDVRWAIEVSNAGPGVATNIDVEDPIRAPLTFVEATGDGLLEDGVVHWTIDRLEPGQSVTVWVTTRVGEDAATGEVSNFVEVVDVDQPDGDSDVDNGNPTLGPAEDDEAVASITLGRPGLGALAATGSPLPTWLALLGLLMTAAGAAVVLRHRRERMTVLRG